MDRLTNPSPFLERPGQAEPDFAGLGGNTATLPPAGRSTMSLADLPCRARGRIVAVEGEEHEPGMRRLRELGLHPGTQISVCHRAPLGDPRCYGFRGTHVALRRTEARRIRVEILRDAH